ncbi:hypothetical protein ELAC_2150 [Estrella lausannensis]|uniref:Uncharacterized protein n=1 Tax=Estrella lausannensis TaxID=483423 RepID=A0A0H5DRX2_9BACT|nr:hypothetical protein ELAC_2150 [Estrella lausannensis]
MAPSWGAFSKRHARFFTLIPLVFTKYHFSLTKNNCHSFLTRVKEFGSHLTYS